MRLSSLLSVVSASLLIGSQAVGQSFQVSNIDAAVWGSSESGVIITSRAHVTNVSSTPKNVRVMRIHVDTLPGTVNYFCWGICFEPEISLSPGHVTLQPGQTNTEDFYGDYMGMGVNGTSTVKYCFLDGSNAQDSVCFHVQYTAVPTSVGQLFADGKPGIAAPYPNPAVREANIRYFTGNPSAPSEIRVYSMLGERLRTVRLKGHEGIAKVNVDGLPAGVYMYSLAVNGREIQTKKLVVAGQ